MRAAWVPARLSGVSPGVDPLYGPTRTRYRRRPSLTQSLTSLNVGVGTDPMKPPIGRMGTPESSCSRAAGVAVTTAAPQVAEPRWLRRKEASGSVVGCGAEGPGPASGLALVTLRPSVAMLVASGPASSASGATTATAIRRYGPGARGTPGRHTMLSAAAIPPPTATA